ncbi:MAG: thioredoxin fold domain-containing protein [Bdellovibrionales bacterium]|nr:thioredoxin fold domain-containing protein [Bdellovibrionales bacterium]
MIEVIGVDKFKTEIYDFTKDGDQEWVLRENTPVILNFSATWCGPCHNFSPTLQDISEEYKNRVKVYRVDIEASPEIPHLFGVMSVPTTVFLKKGEEPAIASGGISVEGMRAAIKDLLGV